MTTIAYKDGVLAADTQVTENGDWICGHMLKIWRLPDHRLFGGSGSAVDVEAVLAWLTDGGDKPEVGENFTGLIISPQGGVTCIENKHLRTLNMEAPYYAIGSGKSVAWGAMFAGADAETAVRAAIKHDTTTGGTVAVLHIHDHR